MRILCIGDISGEAGTMHVERTLGRLRRTREIDFVVANGENTQGRGISADDAQRLYRAGVDVITLGNHAFSRFETARYIETDRYMLRPANFTDRAPGSGCGVFDAPRGGRVAVINLIGRLYMDPNSDNPFFRADAILKELDAEIIIVDMHAEATSEKLAMGRYLDGRVSAVFGTHTHVATADLHILPQGTGYITDVGMTGVMDSVLGVRYETALGRFLGEQHRGPRNAEGEAELSGVLFDIRDDGRCVAAEMVVER